MPDKIKPPSKTLLKKYKNSFKKEILRQLNQIGIKNFPTLKSEKELDDLKYDDKGLVFFVAKNFPEDKFYKELREKQKFNFKNILKYFGL